jgi:hypothetical protein
VGWLVAIIILAFYLLGLFVFHTTGAIHILPFVAFAVFAAYLWLVRRYRRVARCYLALSARKISAS